MTWNKLLPNLAIKKKYDFVICGHIHQPVIKTIETAEGKVIYLNSGDWVEHMTALEYENKNWRLFEYHANDFPINCQEESGRHLNVVTDDITVHFSTIKCITVKHRPDA